MKKNIALSLACLFVAAAGIGCKNKVKLTADTIYSRHLQRHVTLSILNTPLPDQRALFNLLILNDGENFNQLKVQETTDSLNRKNLIAPLVIVGIHSGNRMQEYGVAGFPDYQKNGADAKKYAAFVADELLPFVRKRSGVRKFASVIVAGCSLGGLSAFDIAWNNADKFDKVGVFSGSFWWRDKDVSTPGYTDETDRIMLKVVRQSRKKPHLKYWFYAGGMEEEGDRDHDDVIDVIDDTRDLIGIIKSKNVAAADDIVYKEVKEGRHDYASWSRAFPDFLIWAAGK